MTPPAPCRLLLAGRLAAAVEQELLSAGVNVDIRLVPDGPLSPADAAWADAYSGFSVPPGMPGSVRWFHAMSAGVDTIVGPLRGSQVLLSRTVGAMPKRIGRYVAAHLLATEQHVLGYASNQERAIWDQLEIGREFSSVLILGAGAIAGGVAGVLRSLGYQVTCLSRSGSPSVDRASELVRTSDVLVSALPLTPDTDSLVGRDLLAGLNGGIFVNIGRGRCLDEAALRWALDSGRLARAVLDVFAVEPLPSDSWMWSHPRVSVTPHMSGPTTASDVATDLLATLGELRSGGLPRLAVNLERGY